jgi:hypothetical protein
MPAERHNHTNLKARNEYARKAANRAKAAAQVFAAAIWFT